MESATFINGLEKDPRIEHHFSDGLYAKQSNFPAGSMIVQHRHKYSHLSVLAKGKVAFMKDGEDSYEIEAPACINVPAGVNHAIMALTDTVWFCIHSTGMAEQEAKDILASGGEAGIDKVLIQEV